MRATANSVIAGHDLSGNTALVTGGNAGLGLEACKALASAGARVLLTSRDVARGAEAAASLDASSKVQLECARPAPSVWLIAEQHWLQGTAEAVQLDLCDLGSVRACAEHLLAHEQHLDFVILNAGVMGGPLKHTSDGWESHMAANHMGHFLLCQLLIPKLREQVAVLAATDCTHPHV